MSSSSCVQGTPEARHCLCVLAILFPLNCSAQSQLSPVVVTGSREARPLGQSVGDIVVIDSDTIRNTTADSVEDLLRREAGMQLARNGGPGQSSGFFLRGASTSRALVLIDGVRVGSATLGQAEFEALGLAQIDRIEVLRGPASSLYGADGVGGVVQIFTRRGAGAPRLTGGAAIGGYQSREANLGASGSHGDIDYAVGLGRESSRGVSAVRPNDQFGLFNPDRDGYSRNTGNLRLGYSPALGHRIGISVLETRLNAQFDSAEFDAAGNADPSPDFRNRLTTRVESIDYRGTFSPAWTTSLQVARNLDDLTSGGTTTTRFITMREQSTWQNALNLAPRRMAVSVDPRVGHKISYVHLRAPSDARGLKNAGRLPKGWQAPTTYASAIEPRKAAAARWERDRPSLGTFQQPCDGRRAFGGVIEPSREKSAACRCRRGRAG